MSTGTTLVTLKQALRDALAARPGLSDAQVTYDFPTGEVTGKDIWLGNAESANAIPTMRAGTKKVDESVDLMVYVQVLMTDGQGQEAADLAANELFSGVQQLFAENAQVHPSIKWAQITRWDHKTGSYEGNESAHGSRFEITVNAQARLAP